MFFLPPYGGREAAPCTTTISREVPLAGCVSAPQMGHDLAGEHLHAAPGEIVGQHPELQHRYENTEPGPVAHLLDLRAHGFGAADDCRAAGDETVGGRRLARRDGRAHLE